MGPVAERSGWPSVWRVDQYTVTGTMVGASGSAAPAYEMLLSLSGKWSSSAPGVRFAYSPPAELAECLTNLATSDDPETRLVAIEIGGWMPPTMDLHWLSEAADHDDERSRKAAREALRNRAREAAAMEHLRAIATSPKPLKWARLMTIIESVDPSFLWSRDDPASLGPVLRDLPHEFLVRGARCQKQTDQEAGR